MTPRELLSHRGEQFHFKSSGEKAAKLQVVILRGSCSRAPFFMVVFEFGLALIIVI